ncbi:hypothetical protein TRVL_04518 [Trypanosoma vivax]|nr:hypothetical protein TRVL_04518 [Trypanosoma vivax]
MGVGWRTSRDQLKKFGDLARFFVTKAARHKVLRQTTRTIAPSTCQCGPAGRGKRATKRAATVCPDSLASKRAEVSGAPQAQVLLTPLRRMGNVAENCIALARTDAPFTLPVLPGRLSCLAYLCGGQWLRAARHVSPRSFLFNLRPVSLSCETR